MFVGFVARRDLISIFGDFNGRRRNGPLLPAAAYAYAVMTAYCILTQI